eukprot:2575131-Pleurochrysis_carterae.AAC.7
MFCVYVRVHASACARRRVSVCVRVSIWSPSGVPTCMCEQASCSRVPERKRTRSFGSAVPSAVAMAPHPTSPMALPALTRTHKWIESQRRARQMTEAAWAVARVRWVIPKQTIFPFTTTLAIDPPVGRPFRP